MISVCKLCEFQEHMVYVQTYIRTYICLYMSHFNKAFIYAYYVHTVIRSLHEYGMIIMTYKIYNRQSYNICISPAHIDIAEKVLRDRSSKQICPL